MNKFILKKAGSIVLAGTLVFNLPFFISENRVMAEVSEQKARNVKQELALLVNTVKEYYYEKVDTDKMLEEVLKEADDKTETAVLAKRFVEKLKDPYSEYYTVKELEDFNSSMKGQYYGIGVEISKDEKTGGIRINKIFPNSPAAKAKLKKGDIILKAGKKNLTKLELVEATTYVKGKKGSKITLTILRGKSKKKISVERNEVVMPSVSSKTYEKGKIGYIRVMAFLDNTDEEFVAALNKLEKKGIEGLIIDLRDNGGGLVDVAHNMLDRILPNGKEIYSFGYNDGTKNHYITGNDIKDIGKKDEIFVYPIAILLNGNSASASELFTGALKDYNYAEVVGEVSYGKGVAQSIIPLLDDKDGNLKGGVKLTTIKYYLPNGESINKVGIEPDYKILDDKTTTKDEQLEKAILEIKNKID